MFMLHLEISKSSYRKPLHPGVLRGELETRAGTRLPEVKALRVRGKSLLLDLRLARADPV